MKTNLFGFTLIELMIVICIIGILGAITAGAWLGPATSDSVQQRASQDALTYAHTMHPHWQQVNVLCQGVDNDRDGYVSCTVGDGTETEAIDCHASLLFDYARGCRQQRFGMGRFGR